MVEQFDMIIENRETIQQHTRKYKSPRSNKEHPNTRHSTSNSITKRSFVPNSQHVVHCSTFDDASKLENCIPSIAENVALLYRYMVPQIPNILIVSIPVDYKYFTGTALLYHQHLYS
jgi:hypothetical protein